MRAAAFPPVATCGKRSFLSRPPESRDRCKSATPVSARTRSARSRPLGGVFSARSGLPPCLTFLEFSCFLSRPALDHHFRFRVKLHGVAPLAVQNPEKTFLPAAEREIRHRRRHADIDPDIPRRRFIAESPRRRAAGGEKRGLVPVRASRQKLHRFIHRIW